MALGKWLCEASYVKGLEKRPMPFKVSERHLSAGVVRLMQPPSVPYVGIMSDSWASACGKSDCRKSAVLASFMLGSERKQV